MIEWPDNENKSYCLNHSPLNMKHKHCKPRRIKQMFGVTVWWGQRLQFHSEVVAADCRHTRLCSFFMPLRFVCESVTEKAFADSFVGKGTGLHVSVYGVFLFDSRPVCCRSTVRLRTEDSSLSLCLLCTLLVIFQKEFLALNKSSKPCCIVVGTVRF